MIRYVEVSSSSEKITFFDGFNPETDVWIVPDLRSKLFLQTRLLDKLNFIPADVVLRANEFWNGQVSQLHPRFNIVSSDFAKAFIQSELEKKEEDWLRRPGTADTAFSFLESFMPILAHDTGPEIVSQWLDSRSLEKLKWGHWFYLCKDLWSRFLEEGLLVGQWLAAVLLREERFLLGECEHLYVDLGVHINPVEVEVIKKISEQLNVTVLVPEAEWVDQFKPMRQVYQTLLEVSEKRAINTQPIGSSKISEKGVREFSKMTTMISEVKHATARVRSWADQEYDLRRIVVVAPNIELYWPSLRMHLKKEGIPVDKSTVVRAHSMPAVMQWLSHLRTELKVISFSDLKTRFYSHESRIPLDFAEFDRLYHLIYGAEDIGRHGQVSRYFSKKNQVDERFTFRDFLAWSLRFWSAEHLDEESLRSLQAVTQIMFRDGSSKIELGAEQWLKYLEAIAAKTEVVIEPADPQGIQIVELHSAEYVDCDYLIVLGLTDQALRPQKRMGLSQREVNQLHQDTGFQVYSLDHQQLEFDCLWFFQKELKGVLATFSATDFSGAAQAPSLFWLQEKLVCGEDYEEAVFPESTRWDDVQDALTGEASAVFENKEWLNSLEKIEAGCQIDQGAQAPPELDVKLPQRLSPTAIEQYLKCPFKYAASRLFALSDFPYLDVDVDHMTQGRLMHSLFEELKKRRTSDLCSEEELSKLIEECREKEQLFIGEEKMWPSIKQKHMNLGRRFLEFEKKWQERFPRTSLAGTEVKVDGFFNLNQGALSSQAQEKSFVFTGKVDRIDTNNEGQAVVIDYKSSLGSLKNYGSWINGLQLQLALYSQAIEAGLTKIEVEEVVSAVYYVAKNEHRETGFKLEECDGELYEIGRSRGSKIKREKKKKLFDEINTLVTKAVSEIDRGLYPPRPDKETLCPQCRWRNTCRAPHLN